MAEADACWPLVSEIAGLVKAADFQREQNVFQGRQAGQKVK